MEAVYWVGESHSMPVFEADIFTIYNTIQYDMQMFNVR